MASAPTSYTITPGLAGSTNPLGDNLWELDTQLCVVVYPESGFVELRKTFRQITPHVTCNSYVKFDPVILRTLTPQLLSDFQNKKYSPIIRTANGMIVSDLKALSMHVDNLIKSQPIAEAKSVVVQRHQ